MSLQRAGRTDISSQESCVTIRNRSEEKQQRKRTSHVRFLHWSKSFFAQQKRSITRNVFEMCLTRKRWLSLRNLTDSIYSNPSEKEQDLEDGMRPKRSFVIVMSCVSKCDRGIHENSRIGCLRSFGERTVDLECLIERSAHNPEDFSLKRVFHQLVSSSMFCFEKLRTNDVFSFRAIFSRPEEMKNFSKKRSGNFQSNYEFCEASRNMRESDHIEYKLESWNLKRLISSMEKD